MEHGKEYSKIHLFWHVLEPSSASFLSCICLGILIVLVHIISLSLSFGTILPSILSGNFAASYTNDVVQPLETFFNNSFFSQASTVLLLGIAGYIVYEILARVYGFLRSWEQDEQKMQVVEGHYSKHPSRKYFLGDVAWRILLNIIAIIFLIAAQPLFKKLFSYDHKLFVGQFTLIDIAYILLAVFVWALIAHLAVILLRLYFFKTRLLGEVLY